MKLVVHCRREKFDVYIGRSRKELGWGNPFSWKSGTLAQFLVSEEECLPKYREWLLAQPDLVTRAKIELRSKVLGCWCRKDSGFQGKLVCHGQILAGIANDMDPLSFE